MINVITAERAAEILKAHGYSTANGNKVKQGIAQGVFPFGVAVQMSKHCVYDIWEESLMNWISERESKED